MGRGELQRGAGQGAETEEGILEPGLSVPFYQRLE